MSPLLAQRYEIADRVRRNLLSQFTASSDFIVFSVPVSADGVGLAVIDRRTSQRHLISSEQASMFDPHLSPDGKYLFFVRQQSGFNSHELISCETYSWRCRVLLTSTNWVGSPIGFDDNFVIYVSSPPIQGFDGRERYSKNDIYLLDRLHHQSTKLTDFNCYAVDSLNIAEDNIIFSAIGMYGHASNIETVDAASDIFTIDFDPKHYRAHVPAPLNPSVLIDGYSTKPSASLDGAKIAFLNTRLHVAPYQYDIVVTARDGTVLERARTRSSTFSRPAFVGNTVLAGELVNARYEITLIDLSDHTVRIVYVVNYRNRELDGTDLLKLVF